MRVTLHTLAVLWPMEELGHPDVLVDRVWISSIHLGSWYVHHECKIRKNNIMIRQNKMEITQTCSVPRFIHLLKASTHSVPAGAYGLSTVCKSPHEECTCNQQRPTHGCSFVNSLIHTTISLYPYPNLFQSVHPCHQPVTRLTSLYTFRFAYSPPYLICHWSIEHMNIYIFHTVCHPSIPHVYANTYVHKPSHF